MTETQDTTRPPDQTKWTIDPMLPEGHRGMAATIEGGTKTTLLCWVATRVVQGKDVFGMKVRQGPVLMIDEETPHDSLEKKLYRFVRHFGLDDRTKLPDLVVMSKTDFKFGRANTDLMQTIQNLQPALITIDTLLACLPGGRQGKVENDSGAAIAVRDTLDAILEKSPKSAILVAAHSRKDVAHYDLNDYREAEMTELVRGHGGIVGEACDTG